MGASSPPFQPLGKEQRGVREDEQEPGEGVPADSRVLAWGRQGKAAGASPHATLRGHTRARGGPVRGVRRDGAEPRGEVREEGRRSPPPVRVGPTAAASERALTSSLPRIRRGASTPRGEALRTASREVREEGEDDTRAYRLWEAATRCTRGTGSTRGAQEGTSS